MDGMPFVASLTQPNPALRWIVLGTVAALLASLYIAPVAAIFRFEPLPVQGLLFAFGAGIGGVVASEAGKRLWSACRAHAPE